MAWSARSTLLNALPFFSFHKVHKRHKGAALHAFALSLPTKAPFNPRNFPPHSGMQNPMHTKKGENQIPQHISLGTKQKKVVICFFFFFAQETSIWHVPFPSFQLVGSQNSIPRRFPSKKIHSHCSPRLPNNALRERITRGPCVALKA